MHVYSDMTLVVLQLSSLFDCPLSLYCPFIDCPLSLYCPFIDCLPLSLYCPFIDCLFATFCSLQHYEHYLFIMHSIFGTCCWTPTDNIGGGGVIDCILCLQCNRCLKIVIDYEHYLFIMCSFFWALAVGLSLITWGGGW